LASSATIEREEDDDRPVCMRGVKLEKASDEESAERRRKQ